MPITVYPDCIIWNKPTYFQFNFFSESVRIIRIYILKIFVILLVKYITNKNILRLNKPRLNRPLIAPLQDLIYEQRAFVMHIPYQVTPQNAACTVKFLLVFNATNEGKPHSYCGHIWSCRHENSFKNKCTHPCLILKLSHLKICFYCDVELNIWIK